MSNTKEKKSKQTDNKKISFARFIYNGFFYAVGFTFLGTIAKFASPITDKSPDGSSIQSDYGYGWWILLTYASCGLLALILVLCMGKVAEKFKTDSNGGLYVMGRGTTGRMSGIFVALLVYFTLPFCITYQILMLIKGSFSSHFIGEYPWLANFETSLGIYADLVFDIMGIVIYTLFSFVMFFGMKFYKKFVSATNSLCLITVVVLVIAAIALSFMNGKTNYQGWTGKHSKFNLSIYLTSFSSCFYYFAGFETFISMGKNLENPSKSIKKGCLTIMLIAIVYYIVIISIFFGALLPDQAKQNEAMSIWLLFDSPKMKWITYAGPIFIIICCINAKCNVAAQNTFYAATLLQPLAGEGFISQKISVLNKDNIPVRAALVHIIIVCFLTFFFLLVPDIIKICVHVEEIKGFDVGGITDFTSTFFLTCYLFIFTSFNWLVKKNKVKTSFFETGLFFIGFIVICILLGNHLYNQITAINEYLKNKTNDNLNYFVNACVEFTFDILFFSIFILYYVCYYLPKMKIRDKTFPQISAALNKEFELIPDEIESPSLIK